MRTDWNAVVEKLGRPPRPHLGACLGLAEPHRLARERAVASRAHARTGCIARIEAARAEVFARGDGAVSFEMTVLEREWRSLARQDAEAGLMELWAAIAPPSWIDRKRWCDAPASRRFDVAVALASDPEGVETAEAAVASLREGLGRIGNTIGARVRWLPGVRDGTAPLLGPVVDAALEAVEGRDGAAWARARAHAIERGVHERVTERLPGRPVLAREVADAAFVDALAASDVVDALAGLWGTGYLLAAADAGGVTIELPLP